MGYYRAERDNQGGCRIFPHNRTILLDQEGTEAVGKKVIE
jgi:hypothetical protein